MDTNASGLLKAKKKLEPKPIGSVELLVVFGPLWLLLAGGGIGANEWGWARTNVALIVTGCIFAWLAIWGIIRTLLVRANLIHPLQSGADQAEELRYGAR